MADVYRYNENTLWCFQYGTFYYGFENGSETQIKKEPVTLYGNTINPGDKIKGFDSGNKRTSFSLASGHMSYAGMIDSDLLFDIYDPDQKPQQNNLFQARPKWFLSFSLIGQNAGLLMFSQPGCCYDIHPLKIILP